MAESLCTIHSLEEYRKRKEEEKRRKLDRLIIARASHIPRPVQPPSLFSALVNKFFDMCESNKDEKDGK